MNEPKPPLALTREERNSPLWRKLLSHYEERLDSLRLQNDGEKDSLETANLRGRIAECKALISLNREKTDIESQNLPPR